MENKENFYEIRYQKKEIEEWKTKRERNILKCQ